MNDHELKKFLKRHHVPEMSLKSEQRIWENIQRHPKPDLAKPWMLNEWWSWPAAGWTLGLATVSGVVVGGWMALAGGSLLDSLLGTVGGLL